LAFYSLLLQLLLLSHACLHQGHMLLLLLLMLMRYAHLRASGMSHLHNTTHGHA
jgi:hypothetical protein